MEDCTNRFNFVLVQAVVQIILWHYAITYTKEYIRNNCMNKRWFIQWSKKPNGMGGEIGADGILQHLGHQMQAFFSGIFLCLAYWLGSPQCFIIGAISEFAVELLDTKDIITERFITKKGVWSVEQSPNKLVIFILMHHSGAFLVHLPAAIYYADNPHIQQIGMGLLGFAAITGFLQPFYASRDIYDLQERSQWIICQFIILVFMVYFRWVVASPGIYWFLYEEWGAMGLILKLSIVAFIALFKTMDLGFLMALVHSFYEYTFGGKGVKKSDKISVSSLKRQSSIPISLIRMQSAPIII